jgi:hypothetical protein
MFPLRVNRRALDVWKQKLWSSRAVAVEISDHEPGSVDAPFEYAWVPQFAGLGLAFSGGARSVVLQCGSDVIHS